MSTNNKTKTTNAAVAPGNPVTNSDAWVLTSKRKGDRVAGWIIDSLYQSSIRRLESSERCEITSFCYPPGAKMVKAKLFRADL